MAETAEKVSFQSLVAAAYKLGQDHGESAASWYWDDTQPDIGDYRRVYKAIEEGDPEILDSLPHPDLSGEMADGMTPGKLFEEIGAPVIVMASSNDFFEGLRSDLCSSYEDGFNIAVENVIRNDCETNLMREVTMSISLETSVTEDDLKLLMKDLEEVIGKHNGTCNNIEVTIDDTGDDVTPDDM